MRDRVICDLRLIIMRLVTYKLVVQISVSKAERILADNVDTETKTECKYTRGQLRYLGARPT